MLILGLTGPIGAGKDAVSDYLAENHGFRSFGGGNIVRKVADERGIEPTRENLQDLGEECRDEEGNGFIGKKAAKMIGKSDGRKFVVNGIRNPEEVEVLREEFGDGFVLIYVRADEETRFERLKSRGRTGDPKTFEEFRQQDREDRKRFKMDETFSMADIELSNEGTLRELHERVEEALSNLRP
ncbi:MAG: AAA family ATPase [Candidatus Aenigmatarchaeota archaeon]